MPVIALLAAAGLTLTPALAQSEGGVRIAMQICSGCHGVGGRSESPMFPKLNGQTPEYIEARLTGFREHARGENTARDYMSGMAALLDAAAVKSLAGYFSHQPATRGATGDVALTPKDRKSSNAACRIRACRLARHVTARRPREPAHSHGWPGNTKSIYCISSRFSKTVCVAMRLDERGSAYLE